MTKQSLPQIEVLRDGTTVTRTPFDPVWVENLKILIPAGNREFDGATKQWTIIGHHHVETIIELTRRRFPRVTITDHRPEASASRAVANLDTDYARLHLLPSAPPYAVRLMYREEAKRVHPDHGGKHEAMLSLNACFERLQQAGAA